MVLGKLLFLRDDFVNLFRFKCFGLNRSIYEEYLIEFLVNIYNIYRRKFMILRMGRGIWEI